MSVEFEAGNPIDEGSLFREYARTRSPEIRERLIVANLGLVTHLACRLGADEDLLDDLIQVGYIGLIKAIDRFDESKGSKFVTYAIPTIKGEMRRYLRDKGNLIRVPRHVQEFRADVNRVIERLSQRLGREPSHEEIAAEVDAPVGRVEEAMKARFASTVSLDREHAVPDEEEIATLGALLGRLDEELERTEDRTVLRKALESLTPRQRDIMHLLFYEELSQAETGARLNISQVQVSRLRKAALENLKNSLD